MTSSSIHIVGTGVTTFGMQLETPLRALAAEAVDAALGDAGLDGSEIGLVIFGNAGAGLITGQEMIRAQTSLSTSRVVGRPMVSVENACASSSSALHLANMAVASGSCEFVMVVGAEKMTSTDRTLAGRALATAVDVEAAANATGGPSDAPRPVFMEIYAANTRDYMNRSGATATDLARVTAKALHNGSLNPIAQVREALTVEQVLAAREIASPLTRPMCAGIGDGAAAVIVCTPETARRRGLSGPRIAASVLSSNGPGIGRKIVGLTAERAFAEAGVGPDDLDVVELHDAAAPAEMIVAEELGLVATNGAVQMVRDGDSALGGRLPINPSGGLVARGHPVGATGIAQIVELADQLRGRAGPRQVVGARWGLAENAGGSIFDGGAACMITILTSTS
jgi:acetyl-CoA acetyltransferase